MIKSSDKGSFDAIVCLHLLRSFPERVVTLTGAGVSCASGILDFHSATGLYKTKNKDGSIPYRDVFRTRVQQPEQAAEQLKTLGRLSELCLQAPPSTAHSLLVHLSQLKLLCRSYMQNVDDLDSKAGLPLFDGNGRQVHITLHGSLSMLRCNICSKSCVLTAQHVAQYKKGLFPECKECVEEGKELRLRCQRHVGVLCHQIVYTEDGPESDPVAEEKGLLLDQDASSSPRVFLILGTSLKLSGIRSFMRTMTRSMHRPTDLPQALPNGIRDYNYLDLLELQTSDALVVFVNLEQPRSMVPYIDVWLQEDVQAWSDRINRGLRMRKGL
ncbi:DHS-like NAD/FAD-binding domain-containing protein [Cantharellus anzutake]|uniref:DHS-like NAD/FAD-binding domain-containing protein n=1 Tax=Cantharellus anzutake TaxID=1750568 RepID=UPI0019048B49|nr:DHS-like NAD/FAD-binding domain-containing protein [Cantharellus anzutake]KAF8322923.1 DHS-like NAD/FAD-binding domain-containing protein [Cantharellus anzutake]